MKRNTLFSILATAAFGIVMAGPAAACTFTWTGDDSAAFRVAGNWDHTMGCAADWPTTGDRVVIPNVTTDPVIDQQNEVFGELDILRGGLLTITGKTLTLDGAAVTHDIDGEIHLASSGSNSVLKVTGAVTMDITGKVILQASNAILDLDADVTVSGVGEIKGENNSAQIDIASGVTFTNSLDIVGNMKIKGSGTFVNGSTGVVLANADGGGSPAILLLASSLTIDDVSGASWDATTDPDAVLKFDVGASCLDGNFVINDCAKIQLNGVSIDTRGSYTNNGGLLDLVGSVHFGHSCNAGCTECTTFDSDHCVTGAPSCSCP